jgi:hypothetical protein
LVDRSVNVGNSTPPYAVLVTLLHDLATALAAFGADLEPGWDDRFPFLRFELGDALPASYRLPVIRRDVDLPPPLSRRVRRITQAVARASALFDAAFEARAEILAVIDWSPTSYAPMRGDFETVLPRDAPRDVVGVPGVKSHMRLVARVDVQRLDTRQLFERIANSELGRKPSWAGKAYLVDDHEPLVFHMYDDRGVIVHAPSTERLRALYDRFDGWLVDYWRPQMEAYFGASESR